ncbi:hypothetical protein D3C71_660500 [compost metagenome]
MKPSYGPGLCGQGFIVLHELHVGYIFAKPFPLENLAEVTPAVAETSRSYLF